VSKGAENGEERRGETSEIVARCSYGFITQRTLRAEHPSRLRANRDRGELLAGFLAGVWNAIGMAGPPGSTAPAAIGKGERAQRGTVLGAMGGHGSLQKERLGIFGESRGGEAHY